MELVAGRSCGECSVCCSVLNVDTPEFQKQPGVACAHLRVGTGCSIHATRYPVCRAYHCAWRYLGSLSDDWRPDKSGVLIEFQFEDLPDHYPKRPGVRLTLVDPDKTLGRPFFDTVAGLVASDVPIVLAAPGPPGYFPARAFMNDALREAVLKRDLPRVQAVFVEAIEALKAHHFTRVVHRHRGNPSTPSPPDQK